MKLRKDKNWVDHLLTEYEQGKKTLESMKNKMNADLEMDQKDMKVIDEMMKDMSYAMNWMRKGSEPDSYGGVDKRSAYQRRVMYDMDLLPSLDIEPTERRLTETEKVMITEILLVLSARERQCYLLHMAQGWSMGEISEELSIAKSSVQQFIQRAKKKVACRTKDIQAHLKSEGGE